MAHTGVPTYTVPAVGKAFPYHCHRVDDDDGLSPLKCSLSTWYLSHLLMSPGRKSVPIDVQLIENSIPFKSC